MMYTEQTSPGKFAIQDLSKTELELLIEGLVVLKNEKLIDHENFVHERELAVKMHHSMNVELASSRG